MTTNPFSFGNPIKDPARFVGRQAEVRQISGRLLSSAHESTSLVGERRMGKTSLLYHLAHPQVAAGLGLGSDHYCMVYIDFQGLTDITPVRFWQRVLSKAARASCDPDLAIRFRDVSGWGDMDLLDLEDLFSELAERGLTLVLLLDEFEYVTQNPNFGSDFFGGLRALAIHHNVSLITSTRRELVDLCHSDEIKGSPFFNIFANIVLRPFARADAEKLISGNLAEAAIDPPPEEREFVHRLGGGHPLFLQMAGYYLVEAKAQELSGAALSRYLEAEFALQADPHFNYCWSHSSESEKITLLTILALGQAKQTRQNIPNLENLARLHSRAKLDLVSLSKRALLEETDGVFALFSPAFGRWVGREVTAGPEEEETPADVEAWLAEGGRERLHPAKGALPKFKKQYWPIMGEVLKEISFELIAGVALGKFL
jgi:AAA+ ATPase superfamily predicted ATPase